MISNVIIIIILKFLYRAIYSYKLLRALAALSRNIYNTIQYNTINI